MDNNLVEINSNKIKDLIYMIRGKQVMIDSDLAILYGVTTGNLNKAMKRNEDRFPDDFCFELTEDEYKNLMFQNGISSLKNNYGGRRKMPKAYTEQGISMLSAVLRSEVATKVSITIMRTFVEMRRFLIDNKDMFSRLDSIELNHLKYQITTDSRLDSIDKKVEQVFDYIAEKSEVSQKIFFGGQIYDAFSLLVDIVKQADNSIILIDNYVDIDTLNILAKRNDGVVIKIYTTNKSKLTTEDIEKFNKQYKNLLVKKIATFHDRFLILDERYGFLIGSSLKDAGNKSFGITKIEDDKNIKDILGRLEDEK